jgi:hypothetical protein
MMAIALLKAKIAPSKAKMIAILRFNQQDGDHTSESKE